MITKYASYDVSEILDIKGAAHRQHNASLDKLADFEDYRTEDGYLYVRIRAISSRTNKNHDGWPSVELAGSREIFDHHRSSSGFTVEASDGNQEYGFATFVGKPIFVDHHNSNPKKARGVIRDAKLNVLDHKTAALDSYWSSFEVDAEHLPATEIELLLEVDAKSFPRLAKAIISGELDGFSMGCFVPGTPITLADGTQKKIEDITVSDRVVTHNGNLEPVVYTMKRHYEGVVYEVHSYGQAAPMVLTEEHPIWTKRGWIEARDLQEGDMVLTPRIRETGSWSVHSSLARLVGLYAAEGNLGYDKKRFPDGRPVFVEWNFNAEWEAHLVEQVKSDLAILGFKSCGPYIKNNCATVRCNNPEFASRILELVGQHSWGKRFAPEIVHGWNPDTQKIVLDAYFEGDANRLTAHRVEIGTASSDLAHQVQAMATRIGYRITPPVKQHSPSASHKRAKYSLQGILDGIYHTEKLASLEEEGLWRRVTKIKSREYEGPVYNFDVEGDDSYVAADIAVHNCDVDYSKCSHCGHIASSPEEYCSHITMKGAEHDFKTADGHRVSKKSYENCYGIKFFEISAVFEPADPTALAREVRSAVHKEADDYDFGPGLQPGMGFQEDPVRPHNADIADMAEALMMQSRGQLSPEAAMDIAQRKWQMDHRDEVPRSVNDVIPGGRRYPDEGYSVEGQPKMWDYGYEGENGEWNQTPNAYDPAGNPMPPASLMFDQSQSGDPSFFNDAQQALNEVYPKRPRMNNPQLSSVHTAENELPQNMHTRAPEDIDTLRAEKICPVCGNVMHSETCQVCGYVEPPSEFDNPDLEKAKQIRQEMKDAEENQSTPGENPQVTVPQDGAQPSKLPATARVKSDMHNWTPKVHPKTAARINQLEQPVNASNKAASNEPSKATVVKDQTKPVTAAMQTAQELLNRTRESMRTRTADGPQAPAAKGFDTSPKTRTDVTGIGGVDEASNEAASKADAQIDVTGIGTTGTSDVSADSQESLPTAGRDTDDSGYETSKQVEQIPTKTWGDYDGSEPGVTDPVTREPFPASEDGVKKSRTAYDNDPLETNDQQGGDNGGLQGASPVRGVQPADPIGMANTDRGNVMEWMTSPENNSGPTKTWSGTDGNGVLRQQDPVTRDPQMTGEVRTPDVSLHTTSKVSLAALRLAEAEVELGLVSPKDKWNRVVEHDAKHPAVLEAELKTLARVKTAGLAKLTAHRQASRVPSFRHIATGPEPTQQAAATDESRDAELFLR